MSSARAVLDVRMLIDPAKPTDAKKSLRTLAILELAADIAVPH
jgi:hypothetical protein